MAIRWERKQSAVDLLDLIPDFIERQDRSVRLGAGVGKIDSLVIDCQKLLRLKNSGPAYKLEGADQFGQAFFPWCLSRAAEIAETLSISTITVVCSYQVWRQLETARHLLDGLHSGIHIKPRLLPLRSLSMNLPSTWATS